MPNGIPPPPVAPPDIKGVEDLIQRMAAQNRPFQEDVVRSAFEFSAEMHKNQVRRSGEPYMVHPLAVAYLLADLKFDQTCVVVGLLHDVLEDTLTTRETLEERFGADVTEVVDGVTKIGRHAYVRRDQAQAETFRKMILASARDIRVILVKLADRLHNLQTLEHMSPEARRRISRETLEIYAPIAHRLGMAKVKGDLEDLAFYFLYPHQYKQLHTKLKEKVKLGQGAVERLRKKFLKTLTEAEIEADITFRVKRYYSIYNKLRRQGIDISQLYDYLAFRIITPSVRDCYAALGIVHQSWRPVPGRFKDYIAMPKPNLYQSLHTTVVGEKGQPFEVQIRTREMDLVAEEGIAAHWRYKEGGSEAPASDQNILWLRQLLEWQKEIKDPRTFLTTLKIDLYPDEVYVFSPKGDVTCFPRGATPIDFAYKVHTDLGHHCAGARVNGRLVPLRTVLQNGDLVEILTNPSITPSRDWLTFVSTSRAKSKIRQWLNSVQKERAIEIGRPLLEKELRKYKIGPRKVFESPAMATLLEQEGLSSLDDLLSRIGFGKMAAKNVVQRLLTEAQLAEPATAPGPIRRAVRKILPFGSGPILVKGQGDLLAFLAKCCNPVPGEEIVGYVTRGRGVSVHSAECPNVKNLLYNQDREIDVEWDRGGESRYRVTVGIESTDQPGILAKLTEAIAKVDSNISHLEAETRDHGLGLIEVDIQVKDRRHLEKILRSLRQIPGITRVERRMSGGKSSDALALP
ncbi:MAG: bifunctional (p)ppGpp synthetase/guanosine-3',5'-bis(diphosphate) 3'-pyrophosphohydrolase [Acidobacteria bacterium]|nr:bifunctional (p)ppGpp synthetase/guanosine-3',5'-bis(diphosphate) 3'-pyrophosphohydrolase [Acidobacteriota bacterium]